MSEGRPTTSASENTRGGGQTGRPDPTGRRSGTHDSGGGKTAARALLTRDFLRYLGPGFIVTAGFIDPGNWATNIAGGSEFGYQLLWVVSLATLMLIVFQNMSARLGIVTGHSLAYNVRARFSRPWTAVFGSTIVLACIATDVAEAPRRCAWLQPALPSATLAGRSADGGHQSGAHHRRDATTRSSG